MNVTARIIRSRSRHGSTSERLRDAYRAYAAAADGAGALQPHVVQRLVEAVFEVIKVANNVAIPIALLDALDHALYGASVTHSELVTAVMDVLAAGDTSLRDQEAFVDLAAAAYLVSEYEGIHPVGGVLGTKIAAMRRQLQRVEL